MLYVSMKVTPNVPNEDNNGVEDLLDVFVRDNEQYDADEEVRFFPEIYVLDAWLVLHLIILFFSLDR